MFDDRGWVLELLCTPESSPWNVHWQWSTGFSKVAVLALVAWHAEAGILVHAVPAERSVAARLGGALIQIHLAERPGVPGPAEAGGPGQAALAGAPVLAWVCVTGTVSSVTVLELTFRRADTVEMERGH